MSLLASLRTTSSTQAVSTTVFSKTANASSQSVFNRITAPQAPRDPNKTYRKRQPFRFRLKNNTRARIVVLDEAITYGHAEHEMPDTSPGAHQYAKIYEVCIAHEGICPLDSTDKRAKDVVFLSVIDLTPYTNAKTGKTYPHSKRLMALKRNDVEAYSRISEANGGNLRGLVLDCSRGGDQKSSVNGTPFTVHNEGTIVRLTEDQIVQEFGHEEVKSKEGDRTYKEANEDCYPYDYASIFAPRSALELETDYRIPARPGSRRESASHDHGSAVDMTAHAVVTHALGSDLDLDDEIPF